MPPIDPDITVVGGGVVGLSVALGLLAAGHRVQVLDGADTDARASGGNFGLVWGQGKGWNFAPYARWTNQALKAWPAFSEMLADMSGLDLALEQSGGFEFFTDTEALTEFSAMLAQQQQHLGNQFSYEVLSGDDLRKDIPGIGPTVVGATYSPRDGHVNPLRFLRALRAAVVSLGGQITSNAQVHQILPNPGGGFELTLAHRQTTQARKIVLCAGLGTQTLAPQLGFHTQVRPQRGELLITEKVARQLPFLSSTIRQVDEGGIQIGGTKADAGMDDRETLDVMVELSRHAVAVWPALKDVRVIRAWGALRVMSPDGYPVYAQSRSYPDAYLVTCHSGVTLAALHATQLADWIGNTDAAPDLEAFDEQRFAFSHAD